MQNVLYQYDKKKVRIEYEEIDEGIYIHCIRALYPRKGKGTEVMKKFMEEHKAENIYLLANTSMGTPIDVLIRWYAKLGFETHSVNHTIGKYEYNCFRGKDH